MRESVKAAFRDLTVAWEGGYILWMFPDVKKLISGGFGLLLDPVALAMTVPWRSQDGTLASREQVIAEWSRLKNFVEKNPGSEFWSWKRFEKQTTLRLTPEDMDAAVLSKVAMNETVLRRGFPDYDSWPADAQLGIHSMAWACGPGIWSQSAGRNHWPKLTAACRARDWRTAAVECFMNEEKRNPGIIPRNKGNRVMFMNAAYVEERGHDPDVLIWPSAMSDQEDTQPELVPLMRPDPIQARTVVPFDVVHPKVPLGRDDDDDGGPQAA